MDIRQISAWRIKYLKKKHRERLIFKLDLAECINFAYTGSQPAPAGKFNKGYKGFKDWRNRYIRELEPDTRPTWWQVVKKKGRAMKVG
jgi:hypothetical protein